MFAYEASRYDANGTSNGFDTTAAPARSPESSPGRTSHGRGRGGLRVRRHRLARVRRHRVAGRLQRAALDTASPTARGTSRHCNGYDYHRHGDARAQSTGAASHLRSSDLPRHRSRAYDMSGNVKEWTTTHLTAEDAAPRPELHDAALPLQLRGGAYDIPSFI